MKEGETKPGELKQDELKQDELKLRRLKPEVELRFYRMSFRTGIWNKAGRESNCERASLTVEAALVLPIFLYFIIAFLAFIQIFTVQEKIQSSITKMGLNLAKTAYLFQDFPGTEELLNFDVTIFGREYDIGIDELADNLASNTCLKLYADKYLNTDQINHSCIVKGFGGLNFEGSSLFDGSDYIDIMVSYKVKLPVKIFLIEKLLMTQRVRLRSWTGYPVTAAYQIEEENSEGIVYVTETGSVYHRTESCSHIKLSVKAVIGIPVELRNDSGAKYYPCESCCKAKPSDYATYYITSDGTRYHVARECSRIKRSVKSIPLGGVGARTPCKRCYE